MCLKDKIKHSDDARHSGNQQHSGSKIKEPCKRYNKGKCTYGSACRYEHCCSERKCGKFGHGAHICWVRLARIKNTEGSSSFNASMTDSGSEAGKRN